MTTFQVIYQDMPYRDTAPHGMLVEANSVADAWITAYNELTRRGNVVVVSNNFGDSDKFLNEQDWAIIHGFGIKDDVSGRTQIRNIKIHEPKSPGKVISIH